MYPVNIENAPAWISAVVATIALVVSFRTKSKVKKVTPDFAVVSSDGTVLRHSEFESYGLLAQLQEEQVSSAEGFHPVYTLTFSKVPDYFEVTTMEGATVKLYQSAPKEYKVFFVGAGYGSPIVKSNFKVQVY